MELEDPNFLEDPFKDPLDTPVTDDYEESLKAPEPAPEPEPLEDPDSPGVVLSAAQGIVNGAEGFVESLASLVGVDTNEEHIFEGAANTTVGALVEGITQFAIGFAVGGGILGAVGKATGLAFSGATAASTIAKGAVQGGLADFLAFDAHEKRLSNLLQENFESTRFITDFLAADDSDGQIEGRLKNVLEGAGLGVATDMLFYGLKKIKAGRALKARRDELVAADVAAGINPVVAREKADAAVGGAMRETLNDTTGRPVEVVKDRTGAPLVPHPDNTAAMSEAADRAIPVDHNRARTQLFGDPGTGEGIDSAAITAAIKSMGEDTAKEIDEAVQGFPAPLADPVETAGAVNPSQTPIDQPGGGTRTNADGTTESLSRQEVELQLGIQRINMTSWKGTDELISLVVEQSRRVVGEGQEVLSMEDLVSLKNSKMTHLNGDTLGGMVDLLSRYIDDAPTIRAALYLMDTAVMPAAAKNFEESSSALLAALKEGAATPALRFEFEKSREFFYTIYNVSGGVRTEFGRDLKSIHVVRHLNQAALARGDNAVAQHTAQQLKELLDETYGEIDAEALESLINAFKANKDAFGIMMVENGKTPSSLDKILDYWIPGLLSSPRTPVTNFISPVLMGQLKIFQRGIGGAFMGVDNAVSDMFLETADYINGFRESLDAAKDAWKTVRPQATPTSSKLDEYTPPAKLKAMTAKERLAAQRELSDGPAPNSFDPELYPDSPQAVKGFLGYMSKTLNLPIQTILWSDELVSGAHVRMELRRKLRQEARAGGLVENGAISEYIEGNINRYYMENSHALKGRREFSQGQADRLKAAVAADPRGDHSGLAQEILDEHLLYEETEYLGETINATVERVRGSADKVTFKDSPEYGTLRAEIIGMVGRHPVLRFLMPFVKTPTSILSAAAKEAYSPLQLAGSFMFKDNYFEKSRLSILRDMTNPDPAIRQEMVGRAATATATYSAVGLAAANGNITGRGPTDPEKRKVLLQAGWRPYSIKVGNSYYSYERLDPFASILGGVADLIHYGAYAPSSDLGEFEQVAGGIMVAHLNNLTQKSYLTGVRNFLDVLFDPEVKGGTYLRRMAGSFTPMSGLVGSAKDVTDNQARRVSSMMDQLYSRTPGLSTSVEPYRNMFGEPISGVKRVGEGTVGSIMNFWMPIAYSEVSDEEVFKEMANLHHGFTGPSPVYRGVDLLSFRTSKGQTAFDRFQELAGSVKIGGKDIKTSMSKLIRSPKYKKLSPFSTETEESPRIGAIRLQLLQYRRAAFTALRKEMPEVDAEYKRTHSETEIRERKGLFGSLPFEL